ncbi:tetratricopeptide repeat protein [Magnetococcus marinus]|nr:tetratricopeptide repeat protein [Magnetococcus marinus]
MAHPFRLPLVPSLLVILAALMLVRTVAPRDKIVVIEDTRSTALAATAQPRQERTLPRVPQQAAAKSPAISTTVSAQASATPPKPMAGVGGDAAATNLCDRLAASPDDPQRVSPGVMLEPTTIGDAESACREMVENAPKEGRYFYQLGRILEAKSAWRGARDAHQQASNVWYAMGSYRLGMLLLSGKGGAQDIHAGLRLLQKAALAKLPPAQNAIGVHLANGRLVKRNMREAVRWLRQAAMGGYAPGMHNLSRALMSPRSGTDGRQEALVWLRKAADRGVAEAQYDLGMLYERGNMVPKDAAEAKLWLGKAAKQGHVRALKQLE